MAEMIYIKDGLIELNQVKYTAETSVDLNLKAAYKGTGAYTPEYKPI